MAATNGKKNNIEKNIDYFFANVKSRAYFCGA